MHADLPTPKQVLLVLLGVVLYRSNHVAAQPGLGATTSRAAARTGGGMEWRKHPLLSSR